MFLTNAGRLLIYLSLAVLPLANAPLTGDTLEVKYHLFRILGVAASILYVCHAVFVRPLRDPDGVDAAVLLSLAALGASVIFSESPVGALPGAVDAAGSLAFLSLTRRVFESDHPDGPEVRPVLWVIGASMILPSMMFVSEQNKWGIGDTLGNQNVVSHFLVLSLFAPLFALFAAHSRVKKGLCLTALAALLWLIWLTAARGAVVGLLAALALIALSSAARHWASLDRPYRLATAGLCAVLSLSAPVLLYRYATATDFNVSVRFLSWKYSLSLLADRLMLGYGPGLFAASFEKSKLWMTTADSNLLGLLTVNYAHNDYVELLVDQGALGLAAFLTLIAACLLPPIYRWIREPARAILPVCLFLSLIASLTQAFFDFPYHTPAPRCLFYVLLGLISRRCGSNLEPRTSVAPPPPPRSESLEWLRAFLVLLAALVPGVPMITLYAASALAKVADPTFKSGRYTEVRNFFSMASQLDPTRGQYPFRQGLGEEQAQDFEESRRAFRRALEFQPYFPNTFFHLGTVSMKTDPARAAAAFYATLAFAASPTTLHNLAAMGLAIGDSPAAAAIYTEIARRYPADVAAAHNAAVLKQMGRESAESETYRRALDLYQKDRYDLAEPLAIAAVSGRPGDPDAMFLLGRIVFHRGRHDEAGGWFKKVLAVDPNDAEACYYLASVFFFQNRLPAALDMYQRADRLQPNSTRILFNLGVAYYSIGNFSAMNDCFDSTLALNPNVSTRPKIEELRRAAGGRGP